MSVVQELVFPVALLVLHFISDLAFDGFLLELYALDMGIAVFEGLDQHLGHLPPAQFLFLAPGVPRRQSRGNQHRRSQDSGFRTSLSGGTE